MSEDIIRKCDDLSRNRRFLDNQASESAALVSEAAARKKAAAAAAAAKAAAAAPAGDGSGGASSANRSAAASAAGDAWAAFNDGADADDAAGGPDCAVCRSPMSEELQVRLCLHGAVFVWCCTASCTRCARLTPQHTSACTPHAPSC
jgi:hypothetical protein